MNELLKLDKSIGDLESELADLRSKRDAVLKQEKAAAIESIRKQMSEMGLSPSDLRGIKKPKRNEGKTREASGKYYLIDGEKIPMKPGRMHPRLKAFKAKGGDLNSVLHNADGSKI